MKQKEEMSGSERRIRILEALRQDGKVAVQDLAARFQVTTMTIRRDLHFYERQGMLKMQYGGAELKEAVPPFEDFERRGRNHHREKSLIAAQAASSITEDDVLFLDCSTTVIPMIDLLPEISLTVVTNCLPALVKLSSRPKIRVVSCPGCYQPLYGGLMDYSTVSFLDGFHFAKAFLGASSCSPDFGVSCAEEVESSVKRTVIIRTDHSFLLCDSSKMDRKAFIRFADTRDFEAIYTDMALSQSLQSQYQAAGARLILC